MVVALLIAFRAPVLRRLGFGELVERQELGREDRAEKAYKQLRRRATEREQQETAMASEV